MSIFITPNLCFPGVRVIFDDEEIIKYKTLHSLLQNNVRYNFD